MWFTDLVPWCDWVDVYTNLINNFFIQKNVAPFNLFWNIYLFYRIEIIWSLQNGVSLSSTNQRLEICMCHNFILLCRNYHWWKIENVIAKRDMRFSSIIKRMYKQWMEYDFKLIYIKSNEITKIKKLQQIHNTQSNGVGN